MESSHALPPEAEGFPWTRRKLREIPEDQNDGRWFDPASSPDPREPASKGDMRRLVVLVSSAIVRLVAPVSAAPAEPPVVVTGQTPAVNSGDCSTFFRCATARRAWRRCGSGGWRRCARRGKARARAQSSDVLTFPRAAPRRSVERVPSYLVETYLARGRAREQTARERRARSAAEELTRAGLS